MTEQVNVDTSPISKAFATFTVTVNVADVPEEISTLECMKRTHSMLVASDNRLQVTGDLTRFDQFEDEVIGLKQRYKTGSGGKNLRKIQTVTSAMGVLQLR